MRAAVVVAIALLSACHVVHPAGGECPTVENGSSDEVEGTACDVDHDCFVMNSFSPCLSSWYRCVDGVFHMDRGINASDGESCVDSPITSCSYEGNPSCDTDPTAEGCGCAADGTWHCTCQCYGPLTTCGTCPARFDARLDMTACEPIGNTCSFADGHHCDCVDDGSGTTGKFHCQ